MTWFGTFLILYWASNALLTVALIGRRREPLAPGAAAVVVAIYALLIWGALTVGTHQ